MRTRRRTVVGGVPNHCYQRTMNGAILFYCISDFLVHFTIFCVTAEKYRIQVLALCQMPDHIHSTLVADSARALAAFQGECTRKFALVHNPVCHATGPLFESTFGSVPLFGDKKVRTNLCYVGNNPVERRLCKKAEEYRWNYLAYGSSDHPFSEKLVLRKSSWAMRRAVQEVRAMKRARKPLSYKQLRRLFESLDRKEKLQLCDFIISIYNVIDYRTASRFFDSYDEMLAAMHANTGSEHVLNEIFIGKSDTCFTKMISIVNKELNLKDIHDVLALPADDKYALFQQLLLKTGALPEQVAKFLRLPLHKTGERTIDTNPKP